MLTYARYVARQFDELADGILPAIVVVSITLILGGIGALVALTLIHSA